jgi:hypothetical protein
MKEFGTAKAYQLHEDENAWGGFVYDKDSCSDVVRKFFRGVPTAKNYDPETVNEARDARKTVITSNEKHFVPLTCEAQSRSIFPRCHDCWGLVLIPNLDLQRQYAFNKARVKSGVLIQGKRLVWKAAMWANLCVKITSDGVMHVKKFERCEHCQHDTPIDADWYRNLPTLG